MKSAGFNMTKVLYSVFDEVTMCHLNKHLMFLFTVTKLNKNNIITEGEKKQNVYLYVEQRY